MKTLSQGFNNATRGLFAAQRVRNGEVCAAFGATTGKHFTTVGGSHAFAETVFVDSLTVRGLVCSFHIFELFIFLYATSL